MHKILPLLLVWVSLLTAENNMTQEYVPLDISEVEFETMSSFPSTEKIERPVFSPLKPLVKKRKEREAAFLQRVRKATQTRQTETFPVQQKYRAEVLRRNNVANSSKREFDELVSKYNQKLKKFRDFIDYDAKVHGGPKVSQNYPKLQDVSLKFDDSQQDPNLNDPYLPLITSYENKKYSKKHDELSQLIKRTKKVYPDYKSWLFVISIENYENADKVLFANRTSRKVTEAFKKKLGIPKRHVIVLENEQATGSNISKQLEKMIKRIQPKDSVYFYFVGHAMSGPSGKNYLVAYDGSVDMMSREGLIGMEKIFNAFQRSRAARTFAFIDASFMGVSDGIPLRKGEQYTSPVKKTKYHKRLNIINAAHRDQMANAYFEKGYRLFSYFLIKGALSEKEQDAGEMFDKLQEEITQISKSYGPEFEQEPEFFGYRNLAMQK